MSSNSDGLKESEFDEYVRLEGEIEAKRKRFEKYIFYIVLIVSSIGVASAGLSPNVIQSIVSWFSPSGGHNSTIIYFGAVSGNNLSRASPQMYPTFNNTFVRFNVSFSDSDVNDWHTMYVCNTSNSNYTLVSNNMVYNFTCGGRFQLCNYSNRLMVTDNPLYCDFDIRGWANQTQNFSIFVVDSGNKVTHVNSTWAGDRPPYIFNIQITRI